ncbi:homoserine kinase [Jeotgalibacillus proteolyticus]|uniref:Homoserine kinase n=1 Tax=Jeotgalibacillus proteolyticus TaxID=2082395 RepID=A0A2S5GFS1_9BACL|nr:homoserine kinase [Jeotgalibacillus proteolyticus]PPA71877.1 homoserine kinase [Jeotgalibacillus proteolyticus]
MTFAPFQVRVPATSANLGPGFDSVGLALEIYQSTIVIPSSQWTIEYEDLSHDELPVDDNNLIMSTIRKIEKLYNRTAPKARLTVKSHIPLSRGLGSSAAAIVTGIMAADQLMKLSLTEEEKINIAAQIEGHPDNVAAALTGGLSISRFNQYEVDSIKLAPAQVGVAILVPSFELMTSFSRGSIPKDYSRHAAVASSSASNVMIAALAQNDWSLAGRMMRLDEFHEPYREKWINFFKEIRDKALTLGAYGTAISGAGPSIILFSQKDLLSTISAELKASFSDYECLITAIDFTGAVVSPVYLKENV